MDEQRSAPPARADDAAPLEDADALRTLVLRLLAPRYPGAPAPKQTQLLVGKLPDALPVDVPLPDGSRVADSLVRGSTHINIVADTALPPRDVLDFYRERMAAVGWSELEQPSGMTNGFAHTMPGQPTVFCQGVRGPSLSVLADTGLNGPTDLRLDLNFDPRNSPCAPRHRPGGNPWSILPALTPPASAQQFAEGGSGGSESVSSMARLETELELSAVAAHYRQQLAGAGWASRDEGLGGPAAWSAWTFQDEDGQDWQGTFFILRPGSQGQYLLYLRAGLSVNDGDIGGTRFPRWLPYMS